MERIEQGMHKIRGQDFVVRRGRFSNDMKMKLGANPDETMPLFSQQSVSVPNNQIERPTVMTKRIFVSGPCLHPEKMDVGHKDAVPKTIPAKKKVTFMDKEAHEKPNSAPKHPRTLSVEKAGGQVPASMPEWTTNSGKGTVIMQMMKKMGYVHGKGLGVKGQGIVKPIKAVQNPGRAGVGKIGGQVPASMRGAQFQSNNMPEWTKKSGKGIAIMHMMQKMGYVHGKGLGINEQGIVKPIKAIENPGRAGVGVYHFRGHIMSNDYVPNPRKPHPSPSWVKPACVKYTPNLSSTRITVKGVCVSTTYFEKFGPVEKIDFDCQSTTIKFMNSASADRCLQQDQHTINGIDCKVKRAAASKDERKKMRDSQKYLPTPYLPTQTASNTSLPCAQATYSNSITVSGLPLKSLNAREANAFYLPYFKQFGNVASVERISDSEATVIFRDSAAVENALRKGTIKLDGGDCKMTRSAASTSIVLSGKNQEKEVAAPQNQSEASQKAAQNQRFPYQALLPAPQNQPEASKKAAQNQRPPYQTPLPAPHNQPEASK
ncbi:g-patch domain-containing protein [Ditylenchus destructor]|nr:g-patch domain-containing protein [Ditylenchus destructor]